MILSKWSPITKYTELTNDVNKSGIYIWCIKIPENRIIPYYVGKASNIGWRLTQHMSDLLGGNYTIHKQEDLEKIKELGYQHFIVKTNNIYEPTTIELKVRFIAEKDIEIKAHLNFMVENFYFTFYEIENYREMGAEAEKAVIKKIGKGNLINRRGGNVHKEVEVVLPKELSYYNLKRI